MVQDNSLQELAITLEKKIKSSWSPPPATCHSVLGLIRSLPTGSPGSGKANTAFQEQTPLWEGLAHISCAKSWSDLVINLSSPAYKSKRKHTSMV